MRKSLLIHSAIAMALMSSPTVTEIPSRVYPDNSITSSIKLRRARTRRRYQNQSPQAQKARSIRKKKRRHAKKYNRHFTPRMK